MLVAPFYKIELKMWKQRVVVQMRENISSTEHVPYKNKTPLKFTKHIPTREMSWTLTQLSETQKIVLKIVFKNPKYKKDIFYQNKTFS